MDKKLVIVKTDPDIAEFFGGMPDYSIYLSLRGKVPNLYDTASTIEDAVRICEETEIDYELQI